VVAATAARVPVRVLLLHGLRWEGVSGSLGALLRTLDKAAALLATRVVVVSSSVRSKVLAERISTPGKVALLGAGSANGVDIDRFVEQSTGSAQRARDKFGIPWNGAVLAFVGRLTRDKGIRELLTLWEGLWPAYPEMWLLVAGADEPSDALDENTIDQLSMLPRVIRVPFTDSVQDVYHAAQVLLVLSRREGLGMVALEAAACGIPTIAFAATGVVDTVVNGRTGYLCSPGDLGEMRQRVVELILHEKHRMELGRAARQRVVKEFNQLDVWRNWHSFIGAALAKEACHECENAETTIHPRCQS
jgi:glycosyltransferase involved in cell wall biosynthesis